MSSVRRSFAASRRGRQFAWQCLVAHLLAGIGLLAAFASWRGAQSVPAGESAVVFAMCTLVLHFTVFRRGKQAAGQPQEAVSTILWARGVASGVTAAVVSVAVGWAAQTSALHDFVTDRDRAALEQRIQDLRSADAQQHAAALVRKRLQQPVSDDWQAVLQAEVVRLLVEAAERSDVPDERVRLLEDAVAAAHEFEQNAGEAEAKLELARHQQGKIPRASSAANGLEAAITPALGDPAERHETRRPTTTASPLRLRRLHRTYRNPNGTITTWFTITRDDGSFWNELNIDSLYVRYSTLSERVLSLNVSHGVAIPMHVVWLLDQSPSVRDWRSELQATISDATQNGAQRVSQAFYFLEPSRHFTPPPQPDATEWRQVVSGSSDVNQVVSLGVDLVRRHGGQRVLVIVSDRRDSDGRGQTEWAAQCRAAGIRVYGLGWQVPVRADVGLCSLAHETGGAFFVAEDRAQLGGVVASLVKLIEQPHYQVCLPPLGAQRPEDAALVVNFPQGRQEMKLRRELPDSVWATD